MAQIHHRPPQVAARQRDKKAHGLLSLGKEPLASKRRLAHRALMNPAPRIMNGISKLPVSLPLNSAGSRLDSP
jgi:hypothetical protein